MSDNRQSKSMPRGTGFMMGMIIGFGTGLALQNLLLGVGMGLALGAGLELGLSRSKGEPPDNQD